MYVRKLRFYRKVNFDKFSKLATVFQVIKYVCFICVCGIVSGPASAQHMYVCSYMHVCV